jgi:hypothetical protein
MNTGFWFKGRRYVAEPRPGGTVAVRYGTVLIAPTAENAALFAQAKKALDLPVLVEVETDQS